MAALPDAMCANCGCAFEKVGRQLYCNLPDCLCSADGCKRPRKSMRWCHTHYQRFHLHGDVDHPGPSTEDRAGMSRDFWIDRFGEPYWNEERIIRAIKRWAAAHDGKPPTIRQWSRPWKRPESIGMGNELTRSRPTRAIVQIPDLAHQPRSPRSRAGHLHPGRIVKVGDWYGRQTIAELRIAVPSGLAAGRLGRGDDVVAVDDAVGVLDAGQVVAVLVALAAVGVVEEGAAPAVAPDACEGVATRSAPSKCVDVFAQTVCSV